MRPHHRGKIEGGNRMEKAALIEVGLDFKLSNFALVFAAYNETEIDWFKGLL